MLIWVGIPAAPGWQALPPGEQVLSAGEQSALVMAVYGIKLVYMLLALAALALTWGERGRAWQALQGSLVVFWVGEFFCAINILFYVEENVIFEYLHSLFMVFCLGLLFFCVMEVVDKELLHFSDPRARCAVRRRTRRIGSERVGRTNCNNRRKDRAESVHAAHGAPSTFDFRAPKRGTKRPVMRQ